MTYALILLWAVAGNNYGFTLISDYEEMDDCQSDAALYVVIEGNTLNKQYLTWMVTCQAERRS